MGTTETYVDYCTSISYDDIPADVVEYAKHLVLDTVGVAVGSESRVESSETFIEAGRTLDSGGDGATILATGERTSPSTAAFVNGALAHSLDFDDTHRGASIHPGASIIPTAIATAEAVGASGKRLLTGVVAGYEIACRLGMAVTPTAHYDRGFHGTATCGTFGATAAAGVIRGFDDREFEAAFGLNGSQAAGSLQFLENGGWNKRAHPGLAGRAAVLSATLAEEGFLAASNPIDGDRGFLRGYSGDPDPTAATAGLGTTYELLETGIKPYPCCRYMHASLDLLLELAEVEGIDPGDVESVTVSIPSTGYTIIGDPTNAYPQSFVDAQFNMAFGAALALGRGAADVDAFQTAVESGVPDDLARLVDRTTVTTADWIDDSFPETWSAEVVIETGSETHRARTDFSRGEPENPLSWEALVEKYESLTEPILGADAAATIRHRISTLETHSVSDLIQPFVARDGTEAAPIESD